MKKRLCTLLAALFLCVSCTGCFLLEDWDEEDWNDLEDYDDSGELIGDSTDPNQTWGIYWYLCGSDLESEDGFATEDLEEMMEVELPENVQMVIQTGGAEYWDNDMVDEDKTERYLYTGTEMKLVDSSPMANMGSADTLADFLSFCETNYPADRTMVLFWNHGGGSVSGVAFDENYEYDSLTLSESREAFAAVYQPDAGNPPVDIIGFDACLMATVDTASAYSGFSRYLVASEEMEPGGGWQYEYWLQKLASDPGMDGARLGQVICDTYLRGCEDYGLDDEITLSVVDLSKIDPLLEAYENMGAEALLNALDNPEFFSDFGWEAEFSENYGGNTRDQGYSNMVDLGDLAENCDDLLPGTYEAVLDGLENCVLYQVKGPYRDNANGLSCYHSYNGDTEDLYGYQTEGYGEAFKHFYDYQINGGLSEQGFAYINGLEDADGYTEDNLQEVPELSPDYDSEEYPLYIDEDGYVIMELDADTVNMLKGVYFELAYFDEDDDFMLLLGQDNDIAVDWENGIFKDNFRGVWGAIDGCLVYMEVYYEGDDYTAYSVPILLNGEEYNLRVIYDYNDEQYYILGARKGLDDNGMADRNLVQLRPGDEITTIHYAATISGDDDFEAVEVDTITVTEDTVFEEVDMGDGDFLMMFELVDARNNYAYSQYIQFHVEDGEIIPEILE